MESAKLIDLTSKHEIPIDSDEFLIGRGLRNSYIIEDVQVSRLHCVIERCEAGWRITDKSVNGTQVNDVQLSKDCSVNLFHGDIISVTANTKFLFNCVPPDKKPGGITESEIVDLTDSLIAEAAGLCKHSTVEEVTTSECAVAGAMVKSESQNVDRNLENAENELQCSICTELFIRAVTLNCSHTFCNYCISEWRRKQSVCPICRAKITTAFPTLVVDNFIEKMLESASEDVQSKRREVVALRENLDPKPSHNKTEKKAESPAIEVSSDDEDFSDGLSDSDDADWPFEYYNSVYDGYNGVAGAYYGGYGQCYNCGDQGHWANGCPNR